MVVLTILAAVSNLFIHKFCYACECVPVLALLAPAASRLGSVIGVEYAAVRGRIRLHPFAFVSSSLKRWSATVFCTLGLGLSLHLALLKFYALPCIGPGGCHSIIHSGYGTVFGLPVGLFGALLWAAAIAIPDRTKRGALLLLLAAGSAVFMIIQFFVLRGFCLYCTSHAVAAWVAFALHGETPHRSALLAGIALAVGGFGLARSRAEAHVAATPPVVSGSTPLAAAPAGLPWLAPLTPRSPALVISLNCAACLDLLEELTRQRYTDVRSGPAIFFKVTDENRELTTTFVAAVLGQAGSKRDAFLAVTTLLLTVKDQALSSPAVAAAQLGSLFPGAAAQRDQAARLLGAQTETLHAGKLSDTTPLLVPIGAQPRAFFKTEELFH